MKHTPFYDIHGRFNARFVEFAGYEMPLQYYGILEEAKWTRRFSSIFDVSHMARFLVEGSESGSFLEYSLSNSVYKLKEPTLAQYTLILNERGGIVDDAYVYKLSDTRYLLVVNAANHEKDWYVLRERLVNFDAKLMDITDEISQIAFQGPYSLKIVSEVFGKDITSSKRNMVYIFGNLIITTTGYTGEKGVEIYGKPGDIMGILNEIMKFKEVRWAGLGARDILRAEAGYPLYGNDIDEDTDPFSADLKWFVYMDKDFVGKSALEEIKPRVKRRGFIFEGRGVIPKKGDKVYLDGKEIGYITTGVYSPNINAVICMGYIPPDVKGSVKVITRGKEITMRVVKYPFVNLPR